MKNKAFFFDIDGTLCYEVVTRKLTWVNGAVAGEGNAVQLERLA